MGSAIIREAKPEDVAAILAINAVGQPGVAPLTLNEADAISARAIRCWVAEAAGGISGYLITYASGDVYDGEEFAWFQQQYPAFLYIDQIAVAPESRHDGVGSRLYRAASEYALVQGFSILTCELTLRTP